MKKGVEMKKVIIVILVAMLGLVSGALANKFVIIDSDGVVQGVGASYGKHAKKVDHDKNVYTDAEWQAFGITSEAPYIIKDGAVWRDMTEAETNAVNATLQQDALDKANEKLDMDALFNALASLLNKPRQDVENAYKAGVDPKKAKKEKDK